MMDFRRMKWQAKNTCNSVATKQVTPRISLIAGIDSLGNVYACFTQVNTDSKIMCIYFRELIKVLDKERKGWRNNTIIVLDNARYHCSREVLDFMKAQRMPITFSAPHSYSTAPAELLFSAIKSRQLNPQRLPTGKK